MRRMSHLRRCAARASGSEVGGGRSEKADSSRDCVSTTSRFRNARAARLYRVWRVVVVDDEDGAGSCTIAALVIVLNGLRAVNSTVLVAVGIELE